MGESDVGEFCGMGILVDPSQFRRLSILSGVEHSALAQVELFEDNCSKRLVLVPVNVWEIEMMNCSIAT